MESILESLLVALMITLKLETTFAERRIIDGSPAVLGQFPYIVYVHIQMPLISGRCTGTIIQRNWVLTAAHCCVVDPMFDTPTPVEDIFVLAAIVDLSKPLFETQLRTIKKSVIYPGYSENKRADVCLLKVSEAFTFDDYVQKADLSDEMWKEGPKRCIAAGYGMTETPGNNRLNFVDVTCYRGKGRCPCEEEFENISICNDPGMAGICFGDSGGPLICDGTVQGTTHGGVNVNCMGFPTIPQDSPESAKICEDEEIYGQWAYNFHYIDWIKYHAGSCRFELYHYLCVLLLLQFTIH